MNSVITNAAGIYVLEPIDNNYKTGGGPVSVGACCVVASKGMPFTPIEVNPPSSYWNTNSSGSQDAIFGTPLPKKAYGMEGLRHLAEAAKECNWCEAVRVVNSEGYRYPALSFSLFTDRGTFSAAADYVAGDVVSMSDGKQFVALGNVSASSGAPETKPELWAAFSGPVETSAHRHNESVLIGDDGVFMVFYPIDGSDSVNRTVRITGVNPEKQRFQIKIYDKDDTGYEFLLESHEVGIREDDKDDMGLPAYIETVLESRSRRFRCDFLEGTEWSRLEPTLMALQDTAGSHKAFAFVGGTSGGDPVLADWLKGADLFRRESLSINLLFTAGNTDMEYIARLSDIADDRHIAFFFDAPSYMTSAQAMEWATELGLRSRHSRCYYSAFEANDPWRGGTTVWGVSGAMAAAKARGNQNFTKNVPGVHYAPAGQKRAFLDRTGVKALFPDDIINRDKFYEARINPVVPMTSGGACNDDDLVQHFEQNYIRFGWINDVLDYIDHRFVEAASYAKFEPDGLTRDILYKLTKQILDDLVLSGALVKPRDPSADGLNEYIITVEQREIDLWYVQWAVCVTGAARRIAGQPLLIR